MCLVGLWYELWGLWHTAFQVCRSVRRSAVRASGQYRQVKVGADTACSIAAVNLTVQYRKDIESSPSKLNPNSSILPRRGLGSVENNTRFVNQVEPGCDGNEMASYNTHKAAKQPRKTAIGLNCPPKHGFRVYALYGLVFLDLVSHMTGVMEVDALHKRAPCKQMNQFALLLSIFLAVSLLFSVPCHL